MSRIKGQAKTFDGQPAPIKNEADFKKILANEVGTYFVVFDGDVVIYKKRITFNAKEAERLALRLLEEAIFQFNESQTVREKEKMANVALCISINPLRIH